MKRQPFTIEDHQDAARTLATAHKMLSGLAEKVLKAYGVSSRQGRAADRLLGTCGSQEIGKLRSALEDIWCQEVTPTGSGCPYYGQQSAWGRIIEGQEEYTGEIEEV